MIASPVDNIAVRFSLNFPPSLFFYFFVNTMVPRFCSWMLGGLLALTHMTTTLANPSPSSLGKLPKNCQYLKEVATGQRVITKTISSILATNFDTDFAVPAGVKFRSFKAMMRPQNEAVYGVTVNLKYPDNSYSTAFRKDVAMTRNKVYSLPFQSSTGNQPYQINLNVNGDNNNVYSIAVIGCR